MMIGKVYGNFCLIFAMTKSYWKEASFGLHKKFVRSEKFLFKIIFKLKYSKLEIELNHDKLKMSLCITSLALFLKS